MNLLRLAVEGPRRRKLRRTDRMVWRSRLSVLIIRTGILFTTLLFIGAFVVAGAGAVYVVVTPIIDVREISNNPKPDAPTRRVVPSQSGARGTDAAPALDACENSSAPDILRPGRESRHSEKCAKRTAKGSRKELRHQDPQWREREGESRERHRRQRQHEPRGPDSSAKEWKKAPKQFRSEGD
jgi:hypothetical protein